MKEFLFKDLSKIHFAFFNTCVVCKRQLPNKKYITKNGCLWCDSEYYLKGDQNGKK